MDENNEPKEKKSFSQKYISKYIALDVKTIIPLIIFIGSVSFGAYSAFMHETKVAIVEIAKACDKNENEVIALKEKHIAMKEQYGLIHETLKSMDRKMEKTNELLLSHILNTKKAGH